MELVLDGLGGVREELQSIRGDLQEIRGDVIGLKEKVEAHDEMDCERLEVVRGDIKELRDDLRAVRGEAVTKAESRRKDWRDWLRGGALVVFGCALALLARMAWP